jgi:hypothetical protein
VGWVRLAGLCVRGEPERQGRLGWGKGSCAARSVGKPRVRSRISAPRPGDERRDVPAAPGFSAADAWKEHPSSVILVVPECFSLAHTQTIQRRLPHPRRSLTGCLMCPGVGIEGMWVPIHATCCVALTCTQLDPILTPRSSSRSYGACSHTPYPHDRPSGSSTPP